MPESYRSACRLLLGWQHLPQAYRHYLVHRFCTPTFSVYCEVLQRQLTGLETVVDVGASAGHFAAALAPLVTSYLALDDDEGVLRWGATWNACGSIHRIVSDPCKGLPLADGIADLVIAIDCFHYFRDQARAADELARILKPGGRMIIGHVHQPAIERPYAGRTLTAFALESLLSRSAAHVFPESELVSADIWGAAPWDFGWYALAGSWDRCQLSPEDGLLPSGAVRSVSPLYSHVPNSKGSDEGHFCRSIPPALLAEFPAMQLLSPTLVVRAEEVNAALLANDQDEIRRLVSRRVLLNVG